LRHLPKLPEDRRGPGTEVEGGSRRTITVKLELPGPVTNGHSTNSVSMLIISERIDD